MSDPDDFSPDVLALDCRREFESISRSIREALASKLLRRGLVVGISGRIDSSVTAAVCADTVGPDRVIGLQMPERHSADDTMALSTLVAATNFKQGIRKMLEYTESSSRSAAPWEESTGIPGLGQTPQERNHDRCLHRHRRRLWLSGGVHFFGPHYLEDRGSS
jgi:hypothetical protein